MSQAEQNVRLRRTERNSFSRSPHPYHRKSISLKKSPDANASSDTPSSDVLRSSDSSEDQALEADDEKGPLLRLPAPPVRPRKGLRGGDDPSIELTPAVSPLPTPPTEKTTFTFNDKVGSEKEHQVQKEQDQLYAKYVKRRRAEVVRRLTETALLLAIALLSVSDQSCLTSSASFKVKPGLLRWKYELQCFFAIVSVCYILYPVRRTINIFLAGRGSFSAVSRGFHIPSRFDPGILLYPVLLPICIATSLSNYNWPILANLVLGLASMPSQVIPFSKDGKTYAHWIITLLPVTLLTLSKHQPSVLKLDESVLQSNVQEMSLLFPLHQSLVAAISNLVTTSLDPSEIQLLSAGLINLLLFATTPQFQILKALLWVGGLCLFIFCEFALKAEVALARIPAWRFARNRPSNKGLIGRLNRVLRALLPENRSRFAISASSDSEDETSPKLRPPRKGRKVKSTASQDDFRRSSLEKTFSADERASNGFVTATASFQKLSRSSTFAMYGRAATMAIKWKNIAASPNPFPKLNYLHAQALKILLAIYVYMAVALIILLPVKYFITVRALKGGEAVGWAIGYFIGDIAQVRMFVVSNNLDWWIKLPLNKAQIQLEEDASWIDRYRRHELGSANARLTLAGYCVLVVSIGIVAVLQLNRVVEVDTRRKVFHGVMVAMLLPTIPIDPTFFALALMIVLAVFLMLDLFRASQLPPISRPLTNFLAPYVDGRDYRGPVIVSHIFLLIGCAIPLWLSLADVQRVGDGPWNGWEVSSRNLSMVSGVICVGMGDAAASLIGRRYGKTKWYWGGGKSIEGSAAFAFAVMAGLMASWFWLRIGGWDVFSIYEVPVAAIKALAAGIGASVMESTLTAANDNVVVPIGLWLLVRGLGI